MGCVQFDTVSVLNCTNPGQSFPRDIVAGRQSDARYPRAPCS
jgi:hypothetical protein